MSQSNSEAKYLFRYTTLPFLLDSLYNKRMTLVDPTRWEDTNDSYLIELYKRRSIKKSVLALCFAQYESRTVKAEKYSHWKIYAGSSSGVCMKFNKEALIKRFRAKLGSSLRNGVVKYRTIKRFENEIEKIPLHELPFVKRKAFDDELEYRFIYESDENISSKDVEIELDSIVEIAFNPWIPISVYESLCKLITEIDGCCVIQLDRSTCLDYERWKNAGDKIIAIPD